MAKISNTVLGVLVIHIVSAAPSDLKKLEDIAKVENAELNSDEENEQSQRQRRWYNFEFPPVNPAFFQSFGKQDESFNPSYEYEDPFVEIHISNVVRQPLQAPPPPLQFPPSSTSQFPFYLPVIYVPQIGCSCPPQSENPPLIPNPGQENNTLPVDNEKNMTILGDLVNRFPELDDQKPNFGLVINETDPHDERDDVGRFDPIQTDRSSSRPPSPVEHGSSQASSSNDDSQPPAIEVQAPTTSRPTRSQRNPTISNPFPQPLTSNPFPEAPSACDGAVLSCCQQFEVTYDCFAVQGCPDPILW